MIVDTHTHVVAEDPQRYPFKPVRPEQAATAWFAKMPVTAPRLIQHMDQAGVGRAIVVQPLSAYTYENDCMADAVRQYPDRLIGVCVLDMDQRDAAERGRYWVVERGVHGLGMFTPTGQEAKWLDDPRTFPVWEMAASLDLSVTILLRAHEIARLRPVLERFPEVQVALSHLAFPRLDDGPPFPGAKDLFALARLPNVHLKFSTTNLYAAGAPGVARELFQRLIAEFGPDRLMWGSNFPATYDRSYGEMLELAREALSFLNEADEKVFGGNALRLWPALAQPSRHGGELGAK